MYSAPTRLSSSAPSSGNSGVPRSESMAYANASPALTLQSKLTHFLRFNYRAVMATFLFVFFVLALSSDLLHDASIEQGSFSGYLRGPSKPFEHFGGAAHPGYFFEEDTYVDDNTFRFAAVTDLDQLSKVTDSNKLLFKSVLLPGKLSRDPSTRKYSIEFEPTRMLYSKHNEAGRGMELSELTMYQDRLLTFDDRTGTVFEVLSKDEGKDSYVVPRFVITEGEGDTDKGMKWEWATVKDNELYMGSMGKEYTRPDGSVENTNNLWIAVLNNHGEFRREDWTEKFNFVRAKLGAASPGYIINEAILWSDSLKRWVFLPRRVSSEMYDENKDERKGSNKVVLVNDSFTEATVVDIKMKEIDPLHGFSTLAFIPGTKDTEALAIRTVEEDCVGGEEDVCKQRSYFIVFNVLTGEVLMDELIVPDHDIKFEGVEFVNIYTKEPKH
mmetsp:Transcript_9110/g.12648  ORF Transcript_9110/g.12648 Transcript_9110/m.12648 type:complete len:441 (-) Transcript_9110:172-1494(-)|eukprot:CAMPEP_0185729526 /NCGR_PEP_ID=MMETSP1171-20130828/6302_1 /TAXON_ID=374046 /ORGANISM="Helicotheca tamensis, Strain CCMP826" /LENGTH=440 /DNA_ID=CAMNT_0028398393 /DNA_START=235 /DNA_END=1557 /DNA_ORIENTATION=-